MATGLKVFRERQVDSNHLVFRATSNQRIPQAPHSSHKLLGQTGAPGWWVPRGGALLGHS